MALENVTNTTGIIDILSSLPGVSLLIKIFQIAGVIIIIYVAFLILKSILNIRRNIRLKKIMESLKRIERKVDKLSKPQTKNKKTNNKRAKK